MKTYSVIYFKSKHYDIESSLSYVVRINADSYEDAKSQFEEAYRGCYLWSVEEEETGTKAVLICKPYDYRLFTIDGEQLGGSFTTKVSAVLFAEKSGYVLYSKGVPCQ